MLIRVHKSDPGIARGEVEIASDGQVTAWHGLLFALGLSPCLMPTHRCASCPASAYVTVATEYRDEACLVQALADIGYATVETHAGEGARLMGYRGDIRAERANVIIRRHHVGGSSNDLGWARQPDGSYREIVSEYDSRSTFTKAKRAALGQRYALHKTVKAAKAKGYAVVGEPKVDADGKIRLRLRAWK